jgi:hypothetical protein
VTYSIGIRQYGSLRKVDDNHVPEVNVYYETQSQISSNPPTGQEIAFLQYIKQQIESQEHVHVSYVSVDGTNLVCQWKSLGSPIAVTIIITIIAVAIALYMLSMVLHETYKIISFLGAEGMSGIMQIFALFVMLQFMSMIMGAVTPMLRKKGD